jgi:glycosyltransferase involved in cell wall biosynthesis
MESVLILLPSNSAGGAEKYLNTVVLHFLSLNYNVDVFFLKKRNENSPFFTPSPGLNLYFTVRNRELTGLFEFFFMLFWKQKNSYKYAFSSHVHCNSLLSVLKKFKICYIDHLICRESTNVFIRFSGFRLLFFRAVYKGYSQSIDLLVCQSESMKRQLLESHMLVFTRLNLCVLRNPINLDTKLILDNRFKSKTAISNYLNVVEIVLVARVSLVKNILYALRVLNILKSAQKLDYHLTIVGEISDFVYYSELLKYININNMESSVLFTGQVPFTEKIISKSDVCILTSQAEGFPNVLLEYMKANKIIVCTRCFESYTEYGKVFFVNSEEEMAQQIFNQGKDKLPLNFYSDYLKLHSSDIYFSKILNLLK